MTAKPRTEPETFTVTDCRGGCTHEVEVIHPVSKDEPGFVRIDADHHRVERVGDDDFLFVRPGDVRYTVAAWHERPGGFSCTCPDFVYKSARRTLQCKHCQVSFALKQPSKPLALTVSDLLALAWEE